MQRPKALCEDGVTRLLAGALADCRATRDKRNELVFNAAAALFLIVGIGSFLYYRYKGRLSPEEEAAKRRTDYEHIVGRLQAIQVEREKGKGLITKLPMWDMRSAAPQLR
tara:strand:+ start:300 stop:629 length:330 start_codon:yes stop_codon:yes gene_type:complete